MGDRFLRPALNLTYWGIGNPGPDLNPAQRNGDNLYSDSVVALDADTGPAKLALPVHAERPLRLRRGAGPGAGGRVVAGRPAQTADARESQWVLLCPRSHDGEVPVGEPFIKVNWASGLDERGRPDARHRSRPARRFSRAAGWYNWYSPSYSPRTDLFYISAWEDVSGVFTQSSRRVPARQHVHGRQLSRDAGPSRRGARAQHPARPINTWTEAAGHGAIIAVDPGPVRRSGSSRCTT